MHSHLATTTALILISLAAAAPASLDTRQNSVEVISNCYASGQVALTFDDGPFAYEGDVTSALNGGKGTFFLNGNNYGCIYDRVDQIRALHDQGHTLASHTWSHKDLTTLKEQEINDELSNVEDAFVNILGLKPLYFRPPYGSYNDLVLRVLSYRGYKKMFLWSDDTEDADGETVQYSVGIYDEIIASYPKPHMVLNHSPVQTTPDQVLPYAVPKLQGAGYQLVSVDTCLGSSGELPYEYVGNPGSPDGSWHC